MASVALRWLIDIETPIVLNVNVPDVANEQLGGFRRAHLAKFGAVQTMLTETGSGYVKFEYRDVDAEYEEGTDAALLAAGIASFTPLQPVCEASSVDTTALQDRSAAGAER